MLNYHHSLGLFSRWQTDEIFLNFLRKKVLTSHANCLTHFLQIVSPENRLWHFMQIVSLTWNVKTYFLGKIRKYCLIIFVAPALAGPFRPAHFHPFVHMSDGLFIHLSIQQHLPWVSWGTTSLTVLSWSFWNFACVFFMVWGYASGLDINVR